MSTPTTFPEPLLEQALEADSVSKLCSSLATARTLYTDPAGDTSYSSFLHSALNDALRKPSLPLLIHLLDAEHVPVTTVDALYVSRRTSQALIDTLVARGWDVNQPSDAPGSQGQRLVHYLVRTHDEVLVRWLVENRGARVDDGDIIQVCAEHGSVALFKFLQERGAQLGRRVLHRAVLFGAERGADPGRLRGEDEGARGDEKQRRSAEMVRFLVDDLGLDVNAMDADLGEVMDHWGTPICYAATAKKGARLVQWLLDKGADPNLLGACTGLNAFQLAKRHLGKGDRDETVEVLENWKHQEEGKAP